jgi:hypothetical protein
MQPDRVLTSAVSYLPGDRRHVFRQSRHATGTWWQRWEGQRLAAAAARRLVPSQTTATPPRRPPAPASTAPRTHHGAERGGEGRLEVATIAASVARARAMSDRNIVSGSAEAKTPSTASAA